jgi:hypothetical protein
MSIVYRNDQELGVTFALWDGTVTADEFLAHAHRLSSDAGWPTHKGLHLSDLRTAVVDASIDEDILGKAAALYGSHPRIAIVRLAIVAGEAFEKAALFDRLFLRYQPSAIVFNSLDIACAWLGIEVDRAERTLQQLLEQSRAGKNR